MATRSIHRTVEKEVVEISKKNGRNLKGDHAMERKMGFSQSQHCHVSKDEVEGANHDANANSSFTHAVINMVGMLIGLGQLSTPYAVEKGGWVSAFMLIGLGVMCAYCSHILGKCLKKNPKLRSFVDIGKHAFGAKGRLIASTFFYMEIFMSLVSYTISLHDNLIKVFLGTNLKLHLAKFSSSQLLTVVAVLITLPSLWIRDLSSISFLSTVGILMSLLIFMCVAATAIFGGVKANHTIPVLQLHNFPSISGLYIFGYGGHIVFPDLYKAMKDPSKFTKVSIVSFTVVTTIYTTLGFMGAKMFGNDIKSQITLSMPPEQIVTKIALWATVLTPMTKYALEFTPLAIQLEHALPSAMSGKTKMIIRSCVGSLLLLVILTLALSIPYFEHVLSLTGSLVSAAICLIFPCAFYMKICWGQIPKPLLVLNMSLITFGFILGVMGTISSSKLLFKNYQSHNST
ncbi:amino acid transporter AVT1H [Abrus precatorius]|uniref:Amino acid transporter AVT1H n=1 Tax=Abrus precatorius TaxID=3816 RepID=A0A8B8K3G2_ABRPR|nr:amino acid transporter AVT1H [Abrus precatorius]